MNRTEAPQHSLASVTPFAWLLAAAIVVLLIGGARAVAISEVPAVLVIAATTAWLDQFPIYFDPAGELPLSPMITIAAMVLFGWAPTILGAAAGMIASALRHWRKDTLVSKSVRIVSLSAGALLAHTLMISWPSREVSGTVLTGLGYTVAWLLLTSIRLHDEESVTWTRALRFQFRAASFHLCCSPRPPPLPCGRSARNPSLVDRLLVPPLAAALMLQLYLPRILRGQEQRRALSAVSVLAAAVDAKDPYTADHSAAVAELSRRVARLLGLDEPEVHHVYLTGLLHDVGKTVIPPEILLKPAKLTSDEWHQMQSHVEAGVRIIQSISGLAEIAPLVAATHENVDGSGYPAALAGEQIPLSARINLAVDAFNALTTNRPYRAARSPEAAVRELEAHAGTQFDPEVVAALRTALGLVRVEAHQGSPAALELFRKPAFALLWSGQLVSFLGDAIFFIALTLWVYQLTGSATVLAIALIAVTIGPGTAGIPGRRARGSHRPSRSDDRCRHRTRGPGRRASLHPRSIIAAGISGPRRVERRHGVLSFSRLRAASVHCGGRRSHDRQTRCFRRPSASRRLSAGSLEA